MFGTVVYYWDAEIVSKVTKLLHEQQESFPTKILDMKVILRDLGVVKIPLKLDAKLVKQIPSRLNLKYKERVKVELEKMIRARIIERVEESEVGHIVVHEKKKKGEIRLCVNVIKLNDA